MLVHWIDGSTINFQRKCQGPNPWMAVIKDFSLTRPPKECTDPMRFVAWWNIHPILPG